MGPWLQTVTVEAALHRGTLGAFAPVRETAVAAAARDQLVVAVLEDDLRCVVVGLGDVPVARIAVLRVHLTAEVDDESLIVDLDLLRGHDRRTQHHREHRDDDHERKLAEMRLEPASHVPLPLPTRPLPGMPDYVNQDLTVPKKP